MAGDTTSTGFPITSLRGGLNEDPPNTLAPDECTKAENVEFWDSMLGQRRLGTAALSLTSSGLTSLNEIVHMSEWYPTNDPTLAEYIMVSATEASSANAARRDTSGTWHALSPNDAIDATVPNIFHITTQVLTGKIYISYKSTQDRLHCWDSTNWRRTGLAAPGVPTAADSVTAGTFSGTRYYRVRAVVISGGVVLLRSEPGPVLTFNPSNTKNGGVVTKPVSMPGEGETHWEIEASLDNANFYRMAQVLVATTTFTDQTASPKTYVTPSHAAPTSTDGTSVTYVLLSNQAAQLNLTGTVSNGTYSDGTNIAGRGWIGYDNSAAYIPLTPSLVWLSTQTWYASPDVATALEQASVGGTGQDYAHSGVLSDGIGAYLTIPSARYMCVDGDRLVYGGHHSNTSLMSTVGWTPVTGDPGAGNSERAPIVTTGGTAISTTSVLDNYDNGPITGLAASTFGSWYAFKWQGIFSAVRTGNAAAAYDIQKSNSSRGAIPGSVVLGSDANGVGIIFFLDPNVGPCALLAGGVVKVIYGIQRITWPRVNAKASKVVAAGCWYPRKQQVLWIVSVDGGNSPSFGIRLQTTNLHDRTDGSLGGGWSTFTGKMATGFCMASLTTTVGNLTTKVPYVGMATPDFVQQCDTGTDDNGTAFTGTIISRPTYLTGLLQKFGVLCTSVLATAISGGSLLVNLIRNMGVETFTGSAQSLTPAASETQVVLDLDDTVLSEARCVQVVLTDGAAGANWQVQRVDLSPRQEETVVG